MERESGGVRGREKENKSGPSKSHLDGWDRHRVPPHNTRLALKNFSPNMRDTSEEHNLKTCSPNMRDLSAAHVWKINTDEFFFYSFIF